MNLVLVEGLSHGAALSGLMGALIGLSLKQDPMIWATSSPKDVQAFVGPPSEASKRRKRGWGVVMLVILLGVFGHLAWVVVRQTTDGAPWLGIGIASFIAFQCFNLFDAVVIDVGLVVFKPKWAFVPGSESLPGLRDVKWHVANYVKGFLGGFVFAGLVTGISFVVVAVA